MSDSRETTEDLHAFAAAVAHDLRTPLSVVAGEVEVALRRNRPAEEYREILRRIAAGVDELVRISGDLALFSEPGARAAPPTVAAPLDAVLMRVRERYRDRDDVEISVDGARALRVAVDEDRLLRAIVLLVEHAIRYRKADAVVSLRGSSMEGGRVRLAIDARPSGFWPHAWRALIDDAAGVTGTLRLSTVRRLLAGGAFEVADEAGIAAVHVDLAAIP